MTDSSPAPARRFVVIDDHPLFCEALRVTLARELSAEVAGCFVCLTDALEGIDAVGPLDLALLDLNLPDVTGFDGLIRLKARYPQVPVVVISALKDPKIIGSALAAGAAGFVPKDSSKQTIVEALRTVLSGDRYTPPGYVPPCDPDSARDIAEDAVTRLSDLTPQQANILALICDGKLNKQIAYDLSIAETTVKAHITSILRKLGVRSRTQAVLVAQKAQFDDILKHV